MSLPTTVYVGDLPYDQINMKPIVTDDFLRNLFSEAGKISEVIIKNDKLGRDGVPKPFAFIRYETREEAEKAVNELNYTKLDGVPIRCSLCDPETKKKLKTGKGNLFIKNLDENIEVSQLHDAFANFGEIISCKIAGERSPDGGFKSHGYGYVLFKNEADAESALKDLEGATINNRPIKIEPFKKQPKENPEETYTNIYIKQFPDTIHNNEDLKELFSKYGEVQNAFLPLGEDGIPKGFGWCNMMNHDDAVKAVTDLKGKHMKNLDGTEVEIYADRAMTRQQRKQFLEEQSRNYRRLIYEQYKGRNFYIRNFDENTTEEDLQSIIGRFGEISSLKIMRNAEGLSKKFGFVCFKELDDADKFYNESYTVTLPDKQGGNKQLYVARALPKEERIKVTTRLKAQQAQAKNYGSMPGMPGNSRIGQPANYPTEITERDSLKAEVIEQKGASSPLIPRIKDLSDEQVHKLVTDRTAQLNWLNTA